MNILKHGNSCNKETKEFVCEKCGCKFTAESDEYYVDRMITSLTYPVKYSVYANCPECHKMSRIGFETEQPPTPVFRDYITMTENAAKAIRTAKSDACNYNYETKLKEYINQRNEKEKDPAKQ